MTKYLVSLQILCAMLCSSQIDVQFTFPPKVKSVKQLALPYEIADTIVLRITEFDNSLGLIKDSIGNPFGENVSMTLKRPKPYENYQTSEIWIKCSNEVIKINEVRGKNQSIFYVDDVPYAVRSEEAYKGIVIIRDSILSSNQAIYKLVQCDHRTIIYDRYRLSLVPIQNRIIKVYRKGRKEVVKAYYFDDSSSAYMFDHYDEIITRYTVSGKLKHETRKNYFLSQPDNCIVIRYGPNGWPISIRSLLLKVDIIAREDNLVKYRFEWKSSLRDSTQFVFGEYVIFYESMDAPAQQK